MRKLVTSVHGAATGCPDANGGALPVYHKPAVYLRLYVCIIEQGLEVPGGEEQPISSLFQVLAEIISSSESRNMLRRWGKTYSLKGLEHKVLMRMRGSCGEQDLRCH